MVVRSQPGRESYAAGRIRDQGCEEFLPLGRTDPRASPRPLFPSYLFARSRHTPDLHWLRTTYGVSQIVMAAGEPARVTDATICRIRQMASNDGVIALPGASKFAPGQLVRITEGSFEGYAGTYHEKQSHNRAMIHLPMLGGVSCVLIDEDHLEAA